MKELDKQLAKLVEQSMELAEKTGDFILDQAPDLIQQFITWHTIEHLLGILLAILLFLFGRYMPNYWLRNYHEDDDVKFFKKIRR